MTVPYVPYVLLMLISFAISSDKFETVFEVDPNGYIMYCPCMGRFGNQADQFLGTMLFAKNLNRTLILPPWVEYPPKSKRSVQVPFNRYYKPQAIAQYHRIILMEDFMKYLADKIWPKGNRISFCHDKRKRAKGDGCAARGGNPMDSFWSTFDIEFDSSEFYKPLYFNAEKERSRNEWNRRFSATKYPVLAFTGAPSGFPSPPASWDLQKYIAFSDIVNFKAESFIKENLPRPYVAIHLRNGIDWSRACEHVKSPEWKNRHMFTSSQCLGLKFEKGKINHEKCFPGPDIVAKQVSKAVKKYKANSVFIATDNDDMKSAIRAKLPKARKHIPIIRQPDAQDVHLDLALLSKGDYYIGNCLSSFSTFAFRKRKADGLDSEFFGVLKSEPNKHDEF